jgi:hypothetical protein
MAQACGVPWGTARNEFGDKESTEGSAFGLAVEAGSAPVFPIEFVAMTLDALIVKNPLVEAAKFVLIVAVMVPLAFRGEFVGEKIKKRCAPLGRVKESIWCEPRPTPEAPENVTAPEEVTSNCRETVFAEAPIWKLTGISAPLV